MTDILCINKRKTEICKVLKS